MVSRSQAGLFDWIVQRCTALLIGIYAVFIFAYILIHPHSNYFQWHDLYANSWMRIFSVIVLLSILWHAWIGLWTVLTDYIKCKLFRLLLEIIIILLLLAYFIWASKVLWS